MRLKDTHRLFVQYAFLCYICVITLCIWIYLGFELSSSAVGAQEQQSLDHQSYLGSSSNHVLLFKVHFQHVRYIYLYIKANVSKSIHMYHTCW